MDETKTQGQGERYPTIERLRAVKTLGQGYGLTVDSTLARALLKEIDDLRDHAFQQGRERATWGPQARTVAYENTADGRRLVGGGPTLGEVRELMREETDKLWGQDRLCSECHEETRARIDKLERELHAHTSAVNGQLGRIEHLELRADRQNERVNANHAELVNRIRDLEQWREACDAAGEPFPQGTKYEALAQRVAELEKHKGGMVVSFVTGLENQLRTLNENQSAAEGRIRALEESVVHLITQFAQLEAELAKARTAAADSLESERHDLDERVSLLETLTKRLPAVGLEETLSRLGERLRALEEFAKRFQISVWGKAGDRGESPLAWRVAELEKVRAHVVTPEALARVLSRLELLEADELARRPIGAGQLDSAMQRP